MSKGIYPLLSRRITSTSNPLIILSNIPQTYDDLKLVFSYRRNDAPSGDHYIELNGDTSSVYSWTYQQGSGGTWTSRSSGTALLIGQFPGNTSAAGIYSTSEIYIADYRSNKFKQVLIEEHREDNSTSNSNIFNVAGLYRGSAPVTQILVGYGFAQYSRIDLYGIAR